MSENKRNFPINHTESRVIERITFRKLIVDIISAFNIERGLIYTLKLMFSRPGNMVNLFLKEGRYQIFNVVRLLVLTTGLSLLALHLFGIDDFFQSVQEGVSAGNNPNVDTAQLQEIFTDWYNLALWVAIPIYSLFSYLFNKKAGFNYAEHTVMQAYQICAINILSTVLMLPMLVWGMKWFFPLIMVVGIVYYLWIVSSWMQRRSIGFVIKNLLAYVLANLVYYLLIIICTVVILVVNDGV